MAQTEAAKEKPTKPDDDSSGPDVSGRLAKEARAKILAGLSQYQPAPDHAITRQDIVDNRYVIQLKQPLPDFDTPLNKAYAVIDEQDPDASLYALVCVRHLPQRITIMPQVRNIMNPHFVYPIAASVAELSTTGEQFFVIIFPRPKGKRLSTLLAEKSLPLHSSAFIRNNIFNPIANVLHQFEELGLCHGHINPENIYFGDGKLTLGECVSEPCGYSQPAYFEPLERMISHPAGKGEGEPSVDYYALGILMLMLLPGRRKFVSTPVAELAAVIAEKGSFNTLTADESIPDTYLDIIRGTLHDTKRDRWTDVQLKSWVAGKSFSVITPTYPIEASRPMHFMEKGYLNRKALALAMSRNWGKSTAVLRDGSVIRWVQLSIGQKEIANGLERILKSCGGEKSTNAKLNDELISRSLTMLDPYGPIRLRKLALHVDGLGSMLSEIFYHGEEEEMATMNDVLDFDLANGWADVLKRYLDVLLNNNMSNMLWKLDRLRVALRNHSLGFGIERCLYELTPYFPCQSPLLEGKHVTTLHQLLIALDQLAPRLSKEHDPMDRHIAAFIASRLNLGKNVRIQELSTNRALASHRALVTLKLLEQAQQRASYIRLPGLSAWMAAGLLTVIEHIHSRTLREQVTTHIEACADGGQLRPMLDIMRSAEYVARDKLGFDMATLKYRQNMVALQTLANQRVIKTHSTQVGNRIGYYLSLVIFGVTLYFLYLSGGRF